jgi:hypothetical protein
MIVTNKAALEAAALRAAQCQAPQLPFLRAAADGRHEFGLVMNPENVWPSKAEKIRGPLVMLIADDPSPSGFSIGPDGWKCRHAAKRWARATVIHGTGADLDHYRAISDAAATLFRILVIETDSKHVDAWADFFDRKVLIFKPPPGECHPCPVQRERLH